MRQTVEPRRDDVTPLGRDLHLRAAAPRRARAATGATPRTPVPRSEPVRDSPAMIAGAIPDRRAATWACVTVTHAEGANVLLPCALASFREADGLSLLLPAGLASSEGFDATLPMTCLTLRVTSVLDGVGLTAGVAGALAARGIPADRIAACHHDHDIVPAAVADAAEAALRALAARAQ